jgi:hypothetical protein
VNETLRDLGPFHDYESDAQRHRFWTHEDLLPVVTVVLPVLLLLVLPSLTWSGAFSGATVNVGGDVPNVFFLNPGVFLTHLIGQNTGNGLSGTDTFLPYLSLAVLALAIKSVGLAPQLVISGLVLASTYLGAYVLAFTILPRREQWMSHLSAAVGGSIAAVAPIIAQTFWTNFDPGLYLLPLVPWLCYALIQYLRFGSVKYLVAGAAMTVVTSAGIGNVPESLPVMLLVITLILVLLPHEHLDKWMQTRRLLIFIGTIALVNAYWILPFTAELVTGFTQSAYALSNTGQQGALSLVATLAPFQRLSDVLELRASVPMMANFGWTQQAFSSWYQQWALVGYLPFTIIFGGLFVRLFGHHNKTGSRVPIFALFLVSMVVLGFISLTFPPGARQVFDYLIVHFPGWVAERNFYQTFAIPYVVAVALAASAGFYIFTTIISRNVMITAGLAVVILIGIYGAPLLLGASYRNPYYNASPANRVLSKLPPGYNTLISRIVTSGSAPVLSLPLLQPAWTYLVSDGRNGHSITYIGIPPLYYLYGVQNFVGVASFGGSIAPDISTNLDNSIAIGRANVFARFIRLLGVRWVMSDLSVVHRADFRFVNSQTTPAAALSFAHAVEQNLHAVPVARAGIYSLLQVPANLASSVVSIDRTTDFSMSLNGMSQVAAGFYQGSLRSACPNVTGGSRPTAAPEVSALLTRHVTAGSCFVALRVPYSTLWSATLVENGRTITLQHRQAYGFANGFILPALDRGHVTITFSNESSSFDNLGIVSTLLATIGLFSALLTSAAIRRRDRKRIHLHAHEEFSIS